MKRIFNDFDFAFDLGNIKSIELKSKSGDDGYPCDWYIHIELLFGNEYVLNPETGVTELVIPIIKIKCTSSGSADFVIKEIIKKWEMYLESKDDKKTRRKRDE